MTGYKQFRRKQIAEMRPYQDGERPKWRLHIQSIRSAGSPKPGDVTARNPKNRTDKWLVPAKYFADNF